MQVFKKSSRLKTYIHGLRQAGLSVGLVPTMGALHRGHAVLTAQSGAENDRTVCSIFVNPLQFDNPDDLRNYPRTLDDDLSLLDKLGCDVVYCPDPDDLYRSATVTTFHFGVLESVMEGRYRPGHFNGVALVVSKLFHVVEPDRAYFGQKDWQQFRIISRLVEDLSFNIELRCVPIVRDENGLALSSRNERLTAEGRRKATQINRILEACEQKARQGQVDFTIKKYAAEELLKNDLIPDYFEMADAHSLQPVPHKTEGRLVVLCVAAYIEGVRLIDNRIF